MKKVLITGADGFIGRNVASYLKEQGYYLRGALRKTPSSLNSFDEHIAIGNLEDSPDWSAAVSGMDIVIHLAGRAHVTTSLESDEHLYNKVNCDECLKLAEAAQAAGVKKFIFASSVIVYGATTGEVLSETDPCAPSDSYSNSKLQAEIKLAELASKTNFSIVILRLPLVYGPGVKANFYRLIQLVNSGLPLPFKNIHNLRSIIFVGNLASAFAKVIDSQTSGCKTFLISDGLAISTPDLMEGIAKSLNKKSKLFSFPQAVLLGALATIGKRDVYTKVFRNISVSDQSFLQTFNWRAPYTLQQGLDATVEWYKSQDASEKNKT